MSLVHRVVGRLSVRFVLLLLGIGLAQLGARAQISVTIMRPPQYWTSTKSVFTAIIMTDTPGTYLVSAAVLINGQTTRTYYFDPNAPDFSWDGTTVFDSTHFSDGSTLEVKITATNNIGETDPGTYRVKAPARNRALVYGNNTWSTEPDKMSDVSIWTNIMNFTTISSDQADRYQILAAIPPYQVFFIATHANQNVLEDCFGDGEVGAQFVTDDEVKTAVNQKLPSQPPYTFVHLEGCHTHGDMSGAEYWFSVAFQITDLSGTAIVPNRALLGWRTSILIDQFNREWNDSFWARLEDTYTVYDAVYQTLLSKGTKHAPSDENGGVAIVQISGDVQTKVHGVYGGSLGQWWR